LHLNVIDIMLLVKSTNKPVLEVNLGCNLMQSRVRSRSHLVSEYLVSRGLISEQSQILKNSRDKIEKQPYVLLFFTYF
jgi:hypothetical protein